MAIALRYQRANAVGMPPAFMDAVLFAIENNDPTQDVPAGAVAGALAGGAPSFGSITVTGTATFGAGTVISSAGDLILVAGDRVVWNTRSIISSPADGNILIVDSGGTLFGLLQLGGTSASYPALKRSATAILARLADDSANADFRAGNIDATNNAASLTGSITVGGVGQGAITVLSTALMEFNRAQLTDVQLYGNLVRIAGTPLSPTSSTIPALKRSTTTLQVRLGDDSAYTRLDAGSLMLSGAVFWSSGANTPEGAVTAPIGSLFSRTNGGASTTLYVKESGAGNTGWIAK